MPSVEMIRDKYLFHAASLRHPFHAAGRRFGVQYVPGARPARTRPECDHHELVPEEVRARFNKPAAKAEIFIEDTGSGIPEKDPGKIFKPFFKSKKGGDRPRRFHRPAHCAGAPRDHTLRKRTE